MKLWVDDIRPAPDNTWHVARTALEAIRAIARYNFDIISLDHDISHQVTIGGPTSRPFPCAETFASVAYYITAKYKGNDDRVEVRLHTSNQVAGDEMASILEEANITAKKVYMGAANRLEMEV